MTTDLEQRLTAHYQVVADQLDLPVMTIDDVIDSARFETLRPPHGEAKTRQATPNWLRVAALMIVTVGGLVVIADRVGQTPADEIEVPARLLSDVDELAGDEWVVATRLPDELTWTYALESAEPSPERTLWYGDEENEQRLQILIELGGDGLVAEGEITVISGTEWHLLTPGSGRWTALTQIGATTIRVTDNAAFDDDDRDLLAGLTILDVGELPHAPLGDPERATEVARVDLAGARRTFAVQVSNGYWCGWVLDRDGSAGGCGQPFGPPGELTIDGGSSTVAEDASIGDVTRAGTASSDSARVEVEFSDGSVVSVVPTDLSGQFDRLFWIAAAVVPANELSLTEVRSYDAAGRLLAATAATAGP